jgi:glycosyltransferase involved in cell wall biosynthesis
MNLLFLTQILPYPPNAGPRIKTWNVLRYLVSQGHHVTLASFLRKEEEPYIETVKNLGIELHTVPIQRNRFRDLMYGLRSLVSGVPFLLERDNLPEMRRLVQQLILDHHFDAVHADQLTMAQFVFAPNRSSTAGNQCITVFDAHNATYSILERSFQSSRWFLKPFIWLEAIKVKRYEAGFVKQFDVTLTVTSQDRKLFLDTCSTEEECRQVEGKIKVIPIAVDADRIQPIQRSPDSLNIVTLGTLTYPPNADGIRWFIQEVFPLVRQSVNDATLTIIGKNPPADFYHLAERSGGAIQVTGYVQELAPWLSQAALMVVPVRAGSGMRVRILEAFAYGMPVVTTTIGLEGIEAHVGDHVLVCDQADGFAKEVVRLLLDPSLQSSLSSNGRSLVEQCYNWSVVLHKLHEIYPISKQ